jgi:MoaA/NifB/PqqE/SkfB family radical SAM enzyme
MLPALMRMLTVGFSCNNACVFCAQGDARLARSSAPESEILRAIEAVVPGDVVAFLGGEPTLFAALPAWIRAADARGAGGIVVQTNGRRLAYRAFARTLREASPRLSLDVSLQGSTPAMHDWHTGTAGSFAQTVQGIRNARAEHIAAGVTTVVTRSNFRHLAEIVRVAHAAFAAAIHFVPVAPFGRALGAGPRLVPAPQMVAPYLQRAMAEAARLSIVVQVGEVAQEPAPGAATSSLSETGRVIFAGIGEVEAPHAAAEVVEEHP